MGAGLSMFLALNKKEYGGIWGEEYGDIPEHFITGATAEAPNDFTRRPEQHRANNPPSHQ
jgi:hypothetical protein